MIDILLATYNGEKYIEAQIYSLLSQTYKDWRLIVHDDGSTDSTMGIIKEFQALDERIVLIEDGVTIGNAGGNFLHLLRQESSADFFIFCDQDDIWFENKLETLLGLINKNDYPCASYCNAYTYNGTKITGNTVTFFHRNSLNDSLFLNGGIQGCSLMFNKKLKDILNNFPEYIYMHDHFVTIGAICFGKVFYSDERLMLYRQHSLNVTGNIQVSFFDRIKTFFDFNNPVIESRHFKANKSFYKKFKDNLSLEQKRLFEEYFEYSKAGLVKRIYVVLNNHFKIGKSILPLLIKTLVRKPI